MGGGLTDGVHGPLKKSPAGPGSIHDLDDRPPPESAPAGGGGVSVVLHTVCRSMLLYVFRWVGGWANGQTEDRIGGSSCIRLLQSVQDAVSPLEKSRWKPPTPAAAR